MMQVHNLQSRSAIFSYHNSLKSKADFFDGVNNIDFALPQKWLNDMAEWCKQNYPELEYDDIRFTTVWSYQGSSIGKPMTICKEVAEAYLAREIELLGLSDVAYLLTKAGWNLKRDIDRHWNLVSPDKLMSIDVSELDASDAVFSPLCP